MVVSGRLGNHLIQSSVTTNKVILSPEIYNKQKGMVVSRMNLTLLAVHSSESPSQASGEQHAIQSSAESQREYDDVSQAILKVKDLVYNLIHPFSQQSQRSSEERNQDMIRDNSEERMQGAAAQRFRRTLRPAKQEQQEQREREQRKHRRHQESRESYESDEDSSIDHAEYRQLAKQHSNIDEAPKVPFLPLFIGYQGKPIQGKIDATEKAVEIAREVAKELQDPEEVPQKATLNKFTVLVRLVQTMNSEQLKKVTEELYSSEEVSKEAKAW